MLFLRVTPVLPGVHQLHRLCQTRFPFTLFPTWSPRRPRLTVCSNTQANVALSSAAGRIPPLHGLPPGRRDHTCHGKRKRNIAETFQNSGTAPATVSIAIIPSANGAGNPGLPPIPAHRESGNPVFVFRQARPTPKPYVPAPPWPP